MGDVKVKICGLTRPEDVDAAVDAGADFLGFNFWPRSKRHIAPALAAPLVRRAPSHVLPVGVFVNATFDEVAATVRACGLKAVQLHGDEDAADYAALGVPLWKVVRVRDEASLRGARVPAGVERVLLDAYVEGYGGGGQPFDWTLARAAPTHLGRPVVLAGGLTPDNVAQAVRTARPWGVDVASGVEASPGVKDVAKMRAFVLAARSAMKET